MRDLASILGSGRYAFYSSLLTSSNPVLSTAASYAQSRVSHIYGQLTGKSFKDPTQTLEKGSKNLIQFQMMMNSYLSTLEQLAQEMRANEVTYITNMIKALNPNLVSQEVLESLNALKDGKKISPTDYSNMIIALNKIKYFESDINVKELIRVQQNNISLMSKNFEEASQEERENIQKQYNESYSKYSKNGVTVALITQARQVIQEIEGQITTTVVKKQVTKFNKIASALTATLRQLNKNPELKQVIIKSYAEHLNEKTYEIDKDKILSYIIDTIVDDIVKEGNNTPSLRAEALAKKFIKDLSSKASIDKIISQTTGQSVKVFNKIDNNVDDILYALTKGHQNVVDILINIKETEEVINKLFPPQQAKVFIQELAAIQEEITQAENPELTQRKKTKLNKELKARFKDTDLGQMLIQNLARGKSSLTLGNMLDKQTIKFVTSIKQQLGVLSIQVNKSQFSELIVERNNQKKIVEVISSRTGGSANLKDDVTFIIRVPKFKSITEQEISDDLKQTLKEIDSIIEETIGKFADTYYARDSEGPYANEKAGSANTQKAREDYEMAMRKAALRLEKFYNKLSMPLQKQLDNYIQQTDSFIQAISVKEYDLYQDSLGFHGGSLGAGGFKAIDNIQAMYEAGGISALDTEKLYFALLNCGDLMIGGSNLKISLEQYLLGGAALMMFDEGIGNDGITWLNNMKTSIKNMLPKNLNLYALNSAYIPASYILEAIYRNLNLFYQTQFSEKLEQFSQRNYVTITAPSEEKIIKDNDIIVSFQKTSDQVLKETKIQFLFMAGMLDIFDELAKAFDVDK